MSPSQNIKVHTLRLEIKHLRAELRLLKNLNLPLVRPFSHELREIAHELAPYRDHTVQAKWLKHHHFPPPVQQKRVPRLATLESRVKKIRRELSCHLESKNLAKPKLKKSLASTLKKVKQAKKVAATTPKAKNFHEWRKRAKDLLYQLEFLGEKRKTQKLNQLTKILGRLHDSALIRKAQLPKRTRISAVRIAKKEMKKLQKQALELAPKIKLSSTLR